MAYILGGVEAADVLRSQTTRQILAQTYMRPVDAWAYLAAVVDKVGYVTVTTYPDCSSRWKTPDGKPYLEDISVLAGADTATIKRLWQENKIRDINNYLHRLTRLYQRQVITAEELKIKQYFCLACNPMVYYAFWTLVLHVKDGQERFDYPMVPLGGIRYLPGLQLLLTPYGLAKQVHNFITYQQMKSCFTITYGNTAGRQTTGLALQILPLLTKSPLRLGGHLHYWQQPPLDVWPSGAETGGAVALTPQWAWGDRLALTGEMGYKTQGFMPGYPLGKGALLGLGLTYHW